MAHPSRTLPDHDTPAMAGTAGWVLHNFPCGTRVRCIGGVVEECVELGVVDPLVIDSVTHLNFRFNLRLGVGSWPD